MELGQRIREVRKKNKLTQKQMAETMLVSAPYVSQIESGREIPSQKFLRLFCKEFDINEEWLQKGSGNRDVEPDYYLSRESTTQVGIYAINAITDLLKTKSKTLFASYILMLEVLARMLTGYGMDNELKRVEYIEALTYAFCDLDRYLYSSVEAAKGKNASKNIMDVFKEHNHEFDKDIVEVVLKVFDYYQGKQQ